MDSHLLGPLVFVAIFGAFLLGRSIRKRSPDHHFEHESKDAVKLGAGFIGTMTALVLGLMVASAKNSYDSQKAMTKELFGNALLLDRLLIHYGKEADPARERVREMATSLVDRLWTGGSRFATPMSESGESLYDQIFALKPTTDAQRAKHAQAEAVMQQIAKVRLQLFEESNDEPIPMVFIAVVTIWIAALFLIFGMLSPRNVTVSATLLACALSAAGAIFLVLEMERPFDGLIRVSSAPARAAVEQIGR